MTSFTFSWMYWADERVRDALEKKGFKYFYISWNFWKTSKKDIYKNTRNEYEAIDFVNNTF
jgi:hypothetical protein